MDGLYGTIRPSDIDIEQDVEIYYYYRPTRGTEDADFTTFKPLDSSCLVKTNATDTAGTVTTLLGMYDLKLPVDKFNKKGFYTVYIKPKEIITTLRDVSVLAAYPTVRGIVLSKSDVGGLTDLTGYRVEYYTSSTDSTRSNTTRLITSCNYCEPMLVTISDSYPKATRYRLTDSSSSYLFCTVTPSATSSFKANVSPFIGNANDKVAIINTKFNPIMLEIEMTEHNEDTLSYMLEGDQVRDRDNAVITTYNDDHEIYHQADYYTIKSKLGTPLYDVKTTRENIDSTQSYDNIINNEG